jgi:hypothetical protein
MTVHARRAYVCVCKECRESGNGPDRRFLAPDDPIPMNHGKRMELQPNLPYVDQRKLARAEHA